MVEEPGNVSSLTSKDQLTVRIAYLIQCHEVIVSQKIIDQKPGIIMSAVRHNMSTCTHSLRA